MTSNISVAIRIRPQNECEVNDKCICFINDTTLTVSTQRDVQPFSFDYVANDTASQADIFNKIGIPLVDTCLQGYNSTLFAYGQTGSGKTYTTFGDDGDKEKEGIVPRCLQYLFSKVEELTTENTQFLVTCSMCEIYNEKIIDLLDDEDPKKEVKYLKIRETIEHESYIEGLTQETINSRNDAIELTQKGYKQRHTSSTLSNER